VRTCADVDPPSARLVHCASKAHPLLAYAFQRRQNIEVLDCSRPIEKNIDHQVDHRCEKTKPAQL
jgi:hypothetical protein